MPARTPRGGEFSSSVASSFGRSPPVVWPQPASTSTSARRGPRAREQASFSCRAMRRRVTFSRNVTLSLSRTCVSHCKYCAFATHRAHLHEPDEVERLIDRAARRGVKELLVLTGDDPAGGRGARERAGARR